MIAFLSSLIAWGQEFTKTYPMIALPLTAWILGMGTYALRHVPAAVAKFFKNQLTTSMTFDTSYNVGHQGTFEELMTWFGENKYAGLSRTIRIYFRWVGEDGVKQWQRMPVAGMSESNQLAVWEGLPILISCTRQGGENSLLTESAPYVVTIIRLGRNRESLMRMIHTFRVRASAEKPIRRKLVGTDWLLQGSLRHRSAATVVTNDNIVDQIVDAIRAFDENEAWYNENGIPYKLCICLYGPPGTGKNSIIRAVASTMQRGIDSVALNSVSDMQLAASLVSTAGSKAFILFDDFDNAKFQARNAGLRTDASPEAIRQAVKAVEASAMDTPAGVPMTKEQAEQIEEAKKGVSRHGLLSVLDGEDTPHGRVFFMTTNTMDHIDAAITRPGRIDLRFEVAPLNSDSVRRYLLHRFGDGKAHMLDGLEFADIAGSELESLYKQQPYNLTKLLASIPRKGTAVRVSSEENTELESAPL